MIHESGAIVLFNSSKEGTLIYKGGFSDQFCIGEYLTDWLIESFEDFNGTVTLSND